MEKKVQIQYIIQQQNESEKKVFQRDLRQMMLEDYLITDELRRRLDDNSYRFPAYQPDKRELSNREELLVRSQDYFSVKIHYIDTEVYFHKHDFVELIYAYCGECTHYIEDIANKIVLQENDMIIVNQNVAHAIGKITTDDVILKMVLPTEFIRQNFQYQTVGDQAISDFFSTALQIRNPYYGYMLFRNRKKNCVRAFMEQILIEYFQQQPFCQEAIKNLLSLMFIELARKELAEKIEFYQLSMENLPIQEILHDIEEHCEEITLNTLAEKYAYNESYLSRMIHQITGRSFLQFLSESKCKKAVRLLKTSDMPIEQIAEECGYNNVNNLYRLLRREMGKTPAAIRDGKSYK